MIIGSLTASRPARLPATVSSPTHSGRGMSRTTWGFSGSSGYRPRAIGGQVRLEVTVFQQHESNLYIVPFYAGVATNTGALRTSGLEFDAHVTPLERSNVVWTLCSGVSLTRSRLEELTGRVQYGGAM